MERYTRSSSLFGRIRRLLLPAQHRVLLVDRRLGARAEERARVGARLLDLVDHQQHVGDGRARLRKVLDRHAVVLDEVVRDQPSERERSAERGNVLSP